MKKLFTLIVLTSLSLFVYAQAPQEFFKSYMLDNSLRERSESVIELQNGYILDVGQSSNCTGISTCYNACALIWFDRNGTKVRSKKIGNATGFYGIQAIESTDGSLVVHGNFSSDLLFLKTDSLGTVQWSKAIDAGTYTYGYDMVKIDSMYFVNGTLDFDSSMIYSFTQSGNFRWFKTPVASHGCKVHALTTLNGKIYGIASLKNLTNYTYGACVFEMDVNGNVLNSQIITPAFYGYLDDPAFRICTTSDGNIVAMYGLPAASQYVIKLNSSLDIIWSVDVNATPKFGSGFKDALVADNDGGVWIGSHFQYFDGVAFVHIGSDGALLEKNTYGNGDQIELHGMAYTDDCRLLVSGYRRDGIVYRHWLASLGMDGKIACLDNSYTATGTNAALALEAYSFSMANRNVTVSNTNMVSEEGTYVEENHCSAVADVCAVNAVNGLVDADEVFIYPNPAGDFIFINAGTIKITRLELYDTNGRLLKRTNLLTQLSLEDFDNGVYFVKIYSADSVSVKSFVKL